MLKTIQDEFNRASGLLKFTSLRALGQALGMLVPLIVAKFFASDVFGSFSLARMIIFFFVSLLIAAGQAPFVVYASQEKKQTGKINKSCSIQLLFLGVSLVLFAIIAGLFGTPLAKFAGITKIELFYVGLAYFGICVQTFLSNFFLATDQRLTSSLVELLFGFFNIVFIVIFYFFGSITLNSVFLVYFVSSVPLALISLLFIDYKQITPLDWNNELFHEMLTFTLWNAVGGVAFFLVSWGDNLVLKYYMTLRDIGDYNFAYIFFKIANSFPSFLIPYFLPFISQHIDNPIKVREYLSAKRMRILAAGFVIIIIIIAAAPAVSAYFYDDKYKAAVPAIRMLLIGSMIALYNAFYMNIFNALKEYKFFQTTAVIQVIINLGLDILLVPKLGIMGAAVSTTVGYFCCACLFEIYYRVKLAKILL